MTTIPSKMIFEVTSKHLGTVKPGDKIDISFPYSGITIVKLEASCGCTTPVNDKANSKINVQYKAGEVPPHIKQKGKTEYTTSKTITVRYVHPDSPKDNEGKPVSQKTTLVFTVHIKEPKAEA